jgi:hypothetical protein
MVSGMRSPVIVASSFLLLACAQRSEQQASPPVDSSHTASSDYSAPDTERVRIDSVMGYPFTLVWIPGQRDTEDFDVLSKYRAHSKRLSSQVLILTLDTPSVLGRDRSASSYLVADSTIVTGLSYGDFFKNDCRMGAIGPNGLITGLASTDQGRHHPRRAWQFDTVSLKIRSLLPDSVWCIQEEVD